MMKRDGAGYWPDTNAMNPTVKFSIDLIERESVTPEDAGCQDLIATRREAAGFTTERLVYSEEDGAPGHGKGSDNGNDVSNLWARHGTDSPVLCFAGHTDVVPVGDEDAWSVGPFEARIVDDILYGRGAADMKGAVACFAVAAQRLLVARGADFDGAISLLITGDEEGPAINGTVKMLDWLAARGETLDACLVGEPTNPERLGEMVKIGRRGTITGRLAVHGTQGHIAYPHRADNPIPRLLRCLSALNDEVLDNGTEHFQPSYPVVTTIDVFYGNS